MNVVYFVDGKFSLSTYNDSYSKLYFRSILGRCSSETTAQVFPCEYHEIFKNNFFCRTPLVAASDTLRLLSGLFKKLTMNSHEKMKQLHITQLYSGFCLDQLIRPKHLFWFSSNFSKAKFLVQKSIIL